LVLLSLISLLFLSLSSLSVDEEAEEDEDEDPFGPFDAKEKREDDETRKESKNPKRKLMMDVVIKETKLYSGPFICETTLRKELSFSKGFFPSVIWIRLRLGYTRRLCEKENIFIVVTQIRRNSLEFGYAPLEFLYFEA
jgi:hypothetical protein